MCCEVDCSKKLVAVVSVQWQYLRVERNRDVVWEESMTDSPAVNSQRSSVNGFLINPSDGSEYQALRSQVNSPGVSGSKVAGFDFE